MTAAPGRQRLDTLLADLDVSRAALYLHIRALRGPAYATARPELERLVDTENVAGNFLSQVYGVDIWGNGPSNFATPEEAVSGLIDGRETLVHTLAPALDQHLGQRFNLSDGAEWTIGGALAELLSVETALVSILAAAG